MDSIVLVLEEKVLEIGENQWLLQNKVASGFGESNGKIDSLTRKVQAING